MDANGWFRRLPLALLVVAVVICSGAEGKLITVGGKRNGWSPNVNYTNWVNQESFHLGDWLLFNFNKYMYDVVEVNQTSYEQCNPQGFITNVTRGGRDVIELNETRTYYFICTKGYCYGGMKVAIPVAAQEPLAAPPPHPNAAHRRVLLNEMLAFFVALLWLFAL